MFFFNTKYKIYIKNIILDQLSCLALKYRWCLLKFEFILGFESIKLFFRITECLEIIFQVWVLPDMYMTLLNTPKVFCDNIIETGQDMDSIREYIASIIHIKPMWF